MIAAVACGSKTTSTKPANETAKAEKTKEEGTILKAFPPISFKITIKGYSEMNYRIEKKESFFKKEN